MKVLVSALIVTAFSATVFAAPAKIKTVNSAGAIPAAVVQAASQFASDAIKLNISAVYNKDGNPCLSQGKSYKVDVQVRNQLLGPVGDAAAYEWETVKSVNIDANGGLMELCQE